MAVKIRPGEKVTLTVQYTIVDDDGSEFRDSITMSLPDYENIWLKKTKKGQDDDKMARFNTWKAAKIAASQVVSPPVAPPEPLRSDFATDEEFDAAWAVWRS